MLVKDIINKMTKGKIAEHYGVSPETIQNIIRKLGYTWNNKTKAYEYKGSDPEPSDLDFSTFINTSKRVAKNEVKRGEKEVSSSSIASKKTTKQKQNDSEYDVIDELLNNKQKTEKIYKGFYIDSDIASIIDRVDNRKKSELINQCLRKVFSDKGLL